MYRVVTEQAGDRGPREGIFSRSLGLGLLLLGCLTVACGGDGDDGGDASELTYCDVKPIIDEKCVVCHSSESDAIGPMPLETYDEVLEFESMIPEAIEGTEEEAFMPPLWGNFDVEPEPLTDEEQADLLDWFDSGAPQGECE